MNGRVAAPGKTRICPHCKSVILESARVCPGCQHHLRFDPNALVESRAQATFSALRVEGRDSQSRGHRLVGVLGGGIDSQ